MVQFLEGILKIANLLLAVVAGIIALSLIRVSRERKEFRAWILLITALLFFAVQEILGALRAFAIYESSYLTHINPTIILGLLIAALLVEINVYKK